jgi:hypothetical protein
MLQKRPGQHFGRFFSHMYQVKLSLCTEAIIANVLPKNWSKLPKS